MKTWVRKTLSVGVLAAGALLFTAGGAQAGIGQISAGNDGIANGTQIAVPVQVPVNACGIGVGVLGVGAGLSGGCANGAAHDVDVESARTEGASQISADNNGILNGTQVYAPIQVPVNACGIGVGVAGVGLGASGACTNGAAHDVNEGDRHHHDGYHKKGWKSESRTEGSFQWSQDNDGILNGTQVYAPIQVPVNACGIGVGVLGLGAGLSGACTNGAAHDVDMESARTEDAKQVSSDNDGILNGTQVYVPIQVPINLCGIGVGVLGVGAGFSGSCTNGAAHDVATESARTEGVAQVSADNDGILNGTQVAIPVQVPVNACGIGVGALIGVGAGISGSCTNGAAHDVDVDGDEESLPALGSLTQSLPLLGGVGGDPTSQLPTASDLGQNTKMNVGGLDPMSALAGGLA